LIFDLDHPAEKWFPRGAETAFQYLWKNDVVRSTVLNQVWLRNDGSTNSLLTIPSYIP